MFRLIHSEVTLVRMCPTFDLSCEENVSADGVIQKIVIGGACKWRHP